jgi:hypothetical protein
MKKRMILVLSVVACGQMMMAADALLLEAVQLGDLQGVEQALKNGAQVDFQDEEGMTALMYAAKNKDVANVKKLLDFGANMELKNIEGLTAMGCGMQPYSSYRGSEALEFLISAGAAMPLALKGFDGLIPLPLNIRQGLNDWRTKINEERAKRVLEYRAICDGKKEVAVINLINSLNQLSLASDVYTFMQLQKIGRAYLEREKIRKNYKTLKMDADARAWRSGLVQPKYGDDFV